MIRNRILAADYSTTSPKSETMKPSQLVTKIEVALRKAFAAGKTMEVKNSSRPGGPDSTKFRATISGQVEMESNLNVPGSYGSMQVFDKFLKIGAGIPYENSKKLVKIVLDELAKWVEEVGIENTSVKFGDGTMLFVSQVNGSNWGGIGYRVLEK